MSNILDTRDLQERLEELENQKADYDLAVEELDTARTALDNYLRNKPDDREILPEEIKLEAEVQAAEKAVEDAEMDDEDINELTELQDLKEEVGGEWKYGVQLIPEDDFVDYCQELCEDIGDIPKDMPSYIVIDWDATCNNLRQDYSETTFRDETYLYRA